MWAPGARNGSKAAPSWLSTRAAPLRNDMPAVRLEDDRRRPITRHGLLAAMWLKRLLLAKSGPAVLLEGERRRPRTRHGLLAPMRLRRVHRLQQRATADWRNLRRLFLLVPPRYRHFPAVLRRQLGVCSRSHWLDLHLPLHRGGDSAASDEDDSEGMQQEAIAADVQVRHVERQRERNDEAAQRGTGNNNKLEQVRGVHGEGRRAEGYRSGRCDERADQTNIAAWQHLGGRSGAELHPCGIALGSRQPPTIIAAVLAPPESRAPSAICVGEAPAGSEPAPEALGTSIGGAAWIAMGEGVLHILRRRPRPQRELVVVGDATRRDTARPPHNARDACERTRRACEEETG
eukprot:CAMPEP_0176051868 /NCGR_PEP_ID=MMETSP0120_2-20121206/25787_1 /TAXON_ID=160619 /ORGANISM="Kryptoperidinium foliaceum, Strain CCMP 1326" /LENGTH=346 /DNA_ID=CAMNT_0017385307 /DNA_START=14 /DNA_END=1052 /DNA_ORIENTATION=+